MQTETTQPKTASEILIDELIRTLKAIDRRAKNAYKARPGHDEDIAMIGMMAENAVLKVDPAYDYKP